MPFLSGFGKRKAIKYGTVFPGSNLTDFPKLIKITTDADIAAELTGTHLAVTEADGTTLVPHGLYPSSNPAAGTIILRAKFPTLLTAASTGDVLGYLYYDDGGTDQEDKAGVMDGNYALFMPLEEDPSGSSPQMLDWVTETNRGASVGSMTSGDLVAAQVANGLDLDGSNDAIDISSFSLGTNVLTMEIAAYSSNFNQSSMLFGKEVVNSAWSMRLESTLLKINGGSSGGSLTTARPSDSTWHALAATITGTTGRIYYDGVEQTNGTVSAVSDGSDVLSVGRYSGFGGGYYFTGIVDEVRISNVVRSADWLAYAYDDDFDNADTFSLGAEETDGGGVARSSVVHSQAIQTSLFF